MIKPQKEFHINKLRVQVYADRQTMGAAAARDVREEIGALLKEKTELRMIFAAAPSQNELLKKLSEMDGIEWPRITAFHMDEYIGLPANAPQGFGNFLRARLFEKVPFKKQHYLNPIATDPRAECQRYSELLQEAAIDIVCMGIGENGHIAFNDPPVADFEDPETVKVVELEGVCRQQQVNDGAFAKMSDVPTHALTLTVPALMSGAALFVVVPGPTKTQAVHRTLTGAIDTTCPATILRRHPNAGLYLDRDSAAMV
jgi:glucosamine-6-phosphate deaminase